MDAEEPVFIKGRAYKIERARCFGAYATAKLHENTITIKIPVFLGKERAAKIFLVLKKRMIRSLEKAREYVPKPEYLKFYDGQILQIMGRGFTIKTTEGINRSSRVRFKDGTITIMLASGLAQEQKEAHIYSLSTRVIAKHTLPDVNFRINQLNETHFNFKLDKVRLKEQSSRWGSYSKRTNTINLNIRLLFAPPEVLDSVIIHELAHIKHQNHSKAFWKLVLTAMPDYRERRKWLRENGNSLGVFPKPDTVQQKNAVPETIMQENVQQLQIASIVAEPDSKQQS